MITKTRPKGWMLRLLSALFLTIAFTACSSTEDSIEDPTKPEVPISDDDWQTVSTKGGDIKKDDFTLTLPSGTFKTETKVAVTKVGKGQICGNNEVSEFYQVTAPVTTYKPITIKIKSERLDDDASIVLHSYGYVKSYNELVKTNDIMETTYSNGEYTATLPTLTNGNDTATISYSFGLVKAALSNVSTRAPKGGFAVAEGMVEDIGWKLYVDPAVDKVTGSWEVINNDYHKRLGGYIEECIRKILDLGFTLRTLGKPLRSIPFYYISDPDKYGYFKQSPVDDDFSYVGIGVEKLIESKNDPSQLKSTLIHELFHLFQADYDPREAWIKAGGFNKPKDLKNFAKLNFDQPVTIDNESIIHEMASVWVEQFMNNGELNANYLLTDVFGDVFSFDGLLGFGMELERWNKLLESYQQQGYTMGPWLHYIVKEIKELGKARKDHPVLELFQLFKKKWKSKTYNSYYILEEWINSYDPLFLSTVEIDDYYLKLWQGQVVKGFNISKLLENNNKLFLKNNTGLKKDDSKVSPFGCEVTKIQLIDYKDIKLEDKELVIKQNKPNVHTYVLLTDSKSNTAKFKYVQRNKVIFATEENDSITLSGKTLESLRSEDGTFKLQFFLVTTNKDNKMHSTTVNPSQVTFELRDTQKEEDKFEPRTDITSVDIHWRSSTTGGNWANEDNNKFKYNNMLDTGRDNPIQVSKSGNTISVSGKKKRSSIDVFDCDIEYSFTINYTSKGYGEITDLSLSGSGNAKIGNETISLYDLSLAASHIGYESQSKRTTSESVTWGSTEAEGLKISKFTMKYDSGGNTPTSLTYQSDPTNNVWINIDFGE